jgi:hypothetical protein
MTTGPLPLIQPHNRAIGAAITNRATTPTMRPIRRSGCFSAQLNTDLDLEAAFHFQAGEHANRCIGMLKRIASPFGRPG